MKLFAKKKQAPSPKDTLQKLQDTLGMLEKREDYLEKKVQKELLFAKQNATKNKRAAMMALKRKQTYMAQMEKISGARMTIETMVMAIENSSVNLEAMNALKLGAATMQNMHNHMTVEQVDDTMEDIREQMDLANEISDAISQPIPGQEFDDDELNAELASLEQENLDEQLLQIHNTAPAVQVQAPDLSKLPTPAQSVKPIVNEEEDELRRLQESMALS